MCKDTSIRVKADVHKALINHLENGDRKVGRFTETAILEKIERENNKNELEKSKETKKIK